MKFYFLLFKIIFKHKSSGFKILPGQLMHYFALMSTKNTMLHICTQSTKQFEDGMKQRYHKCMNLNFLYIFYILDLGE